MKKSVIILATALASLASKGNFANTTKIEDNAKKQIVVNFDDQQSKQDKNTFYVPSTKQLSGIDKEPDIIDHQTIITMNMDDIIKTYGQVKWIELMRNHFLEEINILRKEKWLPDLQSNTILNNSAQQHVDFLTTHANMYDFSGNDGQSQNPHIEYNPDNTSRNTPGQRASALWYKFSLIKENISTVWFLRPIQKWSIQDVLNERLWEDWHAKNIFSLTTDIWIGYDSGIIVIDFAKTQ